MLGRIRSWALWRLSPVALAGVLSVELAALAIPALNYRPATAQQYLYAFSLLVMTAGYSWAAFRWEERLEVWTPSVPNGFSTNLLGVWCLAAAVLPMQLCAAVVLAIEMIGLPARLSLGPMYPHRICYSEAVAILSGCAAAASLMLPIAYPLRLAVAVAAYLVVMEGGSGVVMILIGNWRAALRLFHPSNCVIELGCLLLGAVLLVLGRAGVSQFAWLSVPVTLVALRVLARREDPDLLPPRPSEEKAMVAEAWQLVARAVVAASDAAAILRIDTGSVAAVAEVAKVQAGCDAIGENGPNGLAILLADCPGPNADAIANRLRSALRGNHIEANIAVAAKPRDGQSLADLLAVSEAELIAMEAATRSARSVRPEA